MMRLRIIHDCARTGRPWINNVRQDLAQKDK